MSSNKKYVSVFKIKGEPILPPLMTKSKRTEMLKYRELAVALENQRKEERPPTRGSTASLTSEDIKNDFLQVSHKRQVLKETASQGTAITPPINRAGSRITIEDLQKSDTFIYDIKNNTVIIPQTKENEPQSNVKQKSQIKDRDSIGSRQNELVKEQPRDDITRQYILYMEKARALRKQQSSPTTPQKSIMDFLRPATSSMAPKPVPFDKQVCVQIIETKTTLTPTKKQPSPPPTASIPKNTYFYRNENADSAVEKISPRKKMLPIMSCSLNESLEVPEAPKIIRSNSFTLESPSPVLLRHLRSQAQAAKEVLSSKEKIVRLIPKNIDSSPEKNEPKKEPAEKVAAPKPSKVSSLIFSNSAVFKSKKSPYEIKSNAKAKIKKHKTALKKTISSISVRAKPQILPDKGEDGTLSPQKIIENNKNVQNFQEIIKSIQEDHELKLLELAKRQREEQKRMEEAFAEQQRVLLQEISVKMCNMNVDATQRSASSTPQSANSNVTVISKTSPRHTKHIINSVEIGSKGCDDEDNPIASALCKNYLKTAKQAYEELDVLKAPNCSLIERSSPRCSRQLFTNNDQIINSNKLGTAQLSPSKRKHEAANIINAYARGYLTRRLFRTDHVQRIVQTIRDTLVFVLDLYEETKDEEETEESITLKARLLQQLTSACYELNGIFFQMSTKERMNLIAKDRAYIRTRAQIRTKYPSPRI